MRIHAKVAANAGGSFLGRFPVLPCSIEELCDEKGAFRQDKVRAALRDYDELLTWSDKDDNGTIAFSVEFMRQLGNSVQELEKDAENDVRTSAENAVDRSLERRMVKGKYASCRIDVDRHEGHLRVRMGFANPKGVVGAMDQSCRRFLCYAARILRHMALGVGEKGVRVELCGTGDVADIFAEAEYADRKCDEELRIEELREKRCACERRLGEYCSPVDFDCPCCKDGKCVEVKLDPQWRREWREVRNGCRGT